jgi:hypothetical protein
LSTNDGKERRWDKNYLDVEERKGEVDDPTAQPEGKGAIDGDEGSVE